MQQQNYWFWNNRVGWFIWATCTFRWVTAILAWALTSAGTVAEGVFVLVPLWICINASVHPFILLFLSQPTTEYITYFGDMLLVGIPEMIALAAILTVVGRIGMWVYTGKRIRSISLTWVIMFGIPTAIFIVITLLTLWFSLGNVTFELPVWAVQIRGLAAYWYGISSLLYMRLGKPQERQRLEEKDGLIDELRQQIEELRADWQVEKLQMLAQWESERRRLEDVIHTQSIDLSNQKTLLTESKNAQSELQKTINASSDMALQPYGEDCIKWLRSGIASAHVDEIMRFTGHTKRKIENAIDRKALRIAPRSKDKNLVLISSLEEWLKATPPRGEQETGPMMLHIVNQ